MILVVNMNSVVCRLYQYRRAKEELNFIREWTHPESKLRDMEIMSDKPGRYRGDGMGRGAFESRTDPKENEINIFAREVAKQLNLERSKNEYEKLIIIAPPHVNGLLFQHLDKHVKELITNNFQKDYFHLKDQELLQFLKENAQFSNV